MPDIIVLEIVYDNSDIMTDYFDRDHPIQRWYVCDVQGKVITEPKLRRAVRSLPEWLQGFNWKYQKGEKYSMSDHPYGQLRVDEGTGLRFPCSHGFNSDTSPVSLLLTTTWREHFEMNNRVDVPIPPTLEAMNAFIGERIRVREEQQRKYKEARERAKIVQADKTPEQLRAIFDGLNESEKVGVAFGMFPVRLQELTKNDAVGLMKLREEVGPRMTFDGAR